MVEAKMIQQIKNFYKHNTREWWSIVILLVITAVLRLYNIDQYMTFLGDEGRDALMIKRILVEWDIPLIGPATSVGNMYLGPLYYYMMAVPMAIFWLNPVAAAAQVAVIGVLTVGLIYYLARQWFGKTPAILTAFLYAISPVTIIYSRSSWNPNPAPFFALLTLLGFYKLYKTRNFLWMILVGIALAFIVQMHYLALILIPASFLIWVYQIFLVKHEGEKSRHLVLGTLLGIVVFLFLMSPLVIFDFKHNFMNYNSLTTFFTNRETTVNINPLNTWGRIPLIYNSNLIGRYIVAEHQIITGIVSMVILLPVLVTIYSVLQKKKLYWPFLVLSIWLIIGVIGLALYKRNIYDHYLGFLNPAPYLLLAGVYYLIHNLKNKRYIKILNILYFGLFAILIFINIINSPLKNSPSNQLYRTQEIAKFIIKEAQGSPFNFALIAKSNYDDAYEFYLDLNNNKPKELPFEKTTQLFVVCEDSVCEPIGHQKHEIAAFGWAKIDKEYNVEGVRIYKLIHNPDQEKVNE